MAALIRENSSNYYIFNTYFRISKKKKKKILSVLHTSLSRIGQWLWVMFSLWFTIENKEKSQGVYT